MVVPRCPSTPRAAMGSFKRVCRRFKAALQRCHSRKKRPCRRFAVPFGVRSGSCGFSAGARRFKAVQPPCGFCRCYSLKFKDFFLRPENFILQRPENFKEDVFVAANIAFAVKAGRPAGFLWYTVKNQYETALNRVRFIPLQYSSCLPYTVYNIMYFCLFMSLTGPQPAVAVHPNMSPPFLLSERSVSSSISTGCSPKLSAISFSLRSLSRRIR